MPDDRYQVGVILELVHPGSAPDARPTTEQLNAGLADALTMIEIRAGNGQVLEVRGLRIPAPARRQ